MDDIEGMSAADILRAYESQTDISELQKRSARERAKNRAAAMGRLEMAAKKPPRAASKPIDEMTAKELKGLCAERGLSTRGLAEKHEFVALLAKSEKDVREQYLTDVMEETTGPGLGKLQL